MSRLKRLIHEIHRRSLWQVLLIYCGAALVAFQAVQALTEGLGLPQWFPALAIVLFIVGLPIVLATAFMREGEAPRPAAAQAQSSIVEAEAAGAPHEARRVHSAASRYRRSGHRCDMTLVRDHAPKGDPMKSRTFSRRDFLQSSAVGMAGILCGATAQPGWGKELGDRALVYRTLGKTGMRVPVIGMGILSAGTPALMRAALDAGITHFDSTAAQPQQTNNERMIGEVLKGRPRESYIYGTKVHLPQNYQTGLYTDAATEQEFTRILDVALRNLQMDHVDIVYHHMVSRRASAFHEPAMNAMVKAKEAGKARFLGLTTHSNVPEAVHAAVDSGFYEVVMASYNPRQTNVAQVKEAIARAAGAGLGVVAIKVIRGDTERGGEPVNARASLKWVLQDTNVHATIPGFSTFDELETDLSVMDDLSLNDAERLDLEREASGPGMFCQGCGQCLWDCDAQLPIPDLMRAYMYAYGYRQPALAHSVIASLELPRRTCEDCETCTVVCANGWNVAEKIRDLQRLQGVLA